MVRFLFRCAFTAGSLANSWLIDRHVGTYMFAMPLLVPNRGSPTRGRSSCVVPALLVEL